MTSAHESEEGRLSVAIQVRIDRICLEFEDRWQAKESPRIENYLGQVQDSERPQLLLELLRLEVEYRRDGFPPPNFEEYLTRFPHDSAIVREAFEIPQDEPQQEYLVGDRIGEFTIESKLGEGAFGVVYRARNLDTREIVAIKVPHLRILRRAESSQRFAEEARTLARLNHESIVAFRDVITDDQGRTVLVMQQIDGRSLRDWMQDDGLTLDQSIDLLARIAGAIDYAHREGFIHRDLEPRNILIDENGKPHITDFGLALHESHQVGRKGETAGSIAYMSPEQVRGEAHWLDGRADIWAIGVIMYELLTKRRPFRGRNLDEMELEICHRDPKPPRQINPQVTVEMERICLKCLAKSAVDRYTTAHDLANDLLASMGQARTRRYRPPMSLRARRKWLWSSMAVLSLAAFGMRQWLFYASKRQPVALEGTIDVLVTKSTAAKMSSASIRDPRFVPLQADDEIRFLVRVNRAAYIYLLVIDSRGRVALAYPWVTGVMRYRASGQSRVIALSLPTNETWILDSGPTGMMTVVLLAGDATIPSKIDLVTMLDDLEPQIGDPGDESIIFQGGDELTMSHAIVRPERSLTAIEPTGALQPARRNLERVSDKLRIYFDLLVAVSMPFEAQR